MSTIARANGVVESDDLPDVEIRVYLRNCAGIPLVGVPAQEIVLYRSSLCLCPGGNIADAATDVNGCTTFTGTIRGGGCTPTLDLFAGGVSDLAYFASIMGAQCP